MAYFTFLKGLPPTIYVYVLFPITKTFAAQYKPFPKIKNETKSIKSQKSHNLM